MRKTRFILPLVALALCVMPSAALASSGGSTQAIVKDVAKDGKVDGHYTQAELKAAIASPLLKQYGGQGAVESVMTTSQPEATTTTSAPATGESGKLPFTGSDVFLFVAVGGGLLAAGLVLRHIGRRDDEASA
jgi:ABC-type Na+ efflux pump permease subunit